MHTSLRKRKRVEKRGKACVWEECEESRNIGEEGGWGVTKRDSAIFLLPASSSAAMTAASRRRRLCSIAAGGRNRMEKM